MHIKSITYSPKDTDAKPPHHFSRMPLDSAQLVAGYGIEGDRKGGHHKRQINIMAQATLDALHAEGFKTAPGEMGEQMVLEGLDVDNLEIGTRLQLGDHAIVEMTTPREGCDRFEHIQGKEVDLTTGRLGILVQVIESGTVRVGDPVTVLRMETS